MIFKIQNQPEFTWVTIDLPPGQTLYAEAGAMASMSTNVRLKATFKGGFRRLLTKESLFLVEYQADQFTGEVTIAPGPPGDIGHVSLSGNKFYLASSSYLAHAGQVTYSSKFQKFTQGLLSRAGWFLTEMSGVGDVWFNAYGAIEIAELNGDSFIIDNGHIVGFTEGVEYEIVRLGGYKSLLFSGEGFVCRFTGRGKVYYQTKKVSSLVAWADVYRKVVKRN